MSELPNTGPCTVCIQILADLTEVSSFWLLAALLAAGFEAGLRSFGPRPNANLLSELGVRRTCECAMGGCHGMPWEHVLNKNTVAEHPGLA